MWRRWIIRAFFSGVILFCAVAWIGSSRYDFGIRHAYKKQFLLIEIVDGTLFFSRETDPDDYPSDLGLGFHSFAEVADDFDKTSYRKHFRNIAGFYAGDKIDPSPGTDHWLIGLPFWFLTPLAAAALYFLWRRTAKLKPHKAFPVEHITTRNVSP
jgi:hypothetical protein